VTDREPREPPLATRHHLLSDADAAAFEHRRKWLIQARSKERGGKQLPPDDVAWTILLFRAGRGFGKTATLNEWLWWECWRVPGIIGHAVGPTKSDVKGTTFEGPVGLCNIVPRACLKGGSIETAYNSTFHTLRFSNGSYIRGFSATEDGGRLRGPQCQILVCDELREWDKPPGALEQALNNALFGLRLPYPDGTPARALMATTSKTVPYLKRFEKRADVRVVRGSSYENMSNLSETYRNQLLALEGTLLGRQEIHGDYIDEDSDLTIIKRKWIKLWPAFDAKGERRKLPEFSFVIESYDCASSEDNIDVKNQKTDPTACIVLGVFNAHQQFTEAERKQMGIRGRYAALLCEAWSERLGMPELLDRAQKQHRIKWGSPGRRADVVLIEDKSSGPAMRQMMAAWGVPVWASKTGRRDKAMRLHAASPAIAQGCLFVPESERPDRKGMPRNWVEPFLEEVCGFAGEGTVEHDDYVDSLSQAVTFMNNRDIIRAVPEKIVIDYEEQREKDEREARAVADDNRPRGNPYAA
jgi:predicted phage terminase large subunit-like protein